MPTNAALRVPASDVALTETVESLPGCRFHAEKTAFTDDSTRLQLWIVGAEAATIESVLDDDASIRTFERLSRRDGEHLYQLDLSDQMFLVRDVIHQFDGTILETYGSDGHWTFEVRFPNREDVSDAADLCDRFNISATLQSITDLRDVDSAPRIDLTERQQEVLQTAIDLGYFEIPRETTLEDLAAELDCSHQALSECLRRAQENLAADTLDGQTETVEGADAAD